MNKTLRSLCALVLLTFTCQSPAFTGFKQEWNLNQWVDTRDAWSHVGQHHPIIEILAASSNEGTQDKTDLVRTMLVGGKLNVQKDRIGGDYVSICYRDDYGVHTRIFSGQQNVTLPTLGWWQPGKYGRGDRTDDKAGYFHNNQLEEPGRGIINFTLEEARRDIFIGTHERNMNDHDYGPFYRHGIGHDHSRFWFVWGGWSGNKSRISQSNKWIDRSYHINTMYDALKFPGTGNLWFALDKGHFWCGKGSPKSKAEFNANGNQILFDTAVKFPPYQRWWTLSMKDRDHNKYSNIASYRLEPDTSLHLEARHPGRFCYWQDSWQLGEKNIGAVTFKMNSTPTFFTPGVNALSLGKHKSQWLINKSSRGAIAFHSTKSGVTNNTISGYNYVFTVNDTNLSLYRQGVLVKQSDRQVNDNYWISFNDNKISMGYGPTPGPKTTMVLYEDPSPLDAQFFSFCGTEKATLDVTNIKVTDVGDRLTAPEGGQYLWRAEQSLPQQGRGNIMFQARNTGSGNADRLIKLALSSTSKPDSDAIAEVKWGASKGGTQPNQVGQIFFHNTNVREQDSLDADGAPLGAVDEDNLWQDFWVSFSASTIAYGKGRDIGVNTIDSWVDPASSNNLSEAKFFGLGANSSTVEFRRVVASEAKDQSNYFANHTNNFKYNEWLPAWTFSQASQGGTSFSVTPSTIDVAPGNIHVGLTTPGSITTTSALYDVVINHDGKAYIKKLGVIQEDSAVQMKASHLPTSKEGELSTFWVLFNNGLIIVGSGSLDSMNNAENVILTWQDSNFDAEKTPIKRYSFTSGPPHNVNFKKISPILLATVQDRLDAMNAVLASKEEIEGAWKADPANQTITSVHANQLFWHDDRMFERDNKTSFSCKVQKMDNEDMNMLIGLSSTADNTFGLAKYTLSLKESGELTLHKAGAAEPLATTTSESLKTLGDRRLHSLWLNYDYGTFSLGIDMPTGSNPIWTFTDPAPVNDIRYLALGTSAAIMQYTSIAFSKFYDPTTIVTNDDLSYQWKDEWRFNEPGKGTVKFTLKNTDAKNRPVILYIGLGGETLPADESVHYNGGQYNLMIDYTGLILVRRRRQDPTNQSEPGLSQKLGEARPDDQTHLDRIKSLSDGSEHNCWLIYENGWFTFGVDTDAGSDPVWTWNDDMVIPNMQHYAFSCLQSEATLTKISAQDAQTVRSLERSFSTMSMLLLTNPVALIPKIDSAVMLRSYKEDMPRFISILQTLSTNRELFTQEQRDGLARTIRDVTHEPSLDADQKKIIEDVASNLSTEIALTALIDSYNATLPSVLELDTTDHARQLFFKKIQALAELPPMQIQEPGIIQKIQAKILTFKEDPLIEYDHAEPAKDLTSSERRIIGSLQLRTTAEETIVNLQDPSYVLSKIPEMTDLTARIGTLAALLNARRANIENDDDAFLFVYKREEDITAHKNGDLPTLEVVLLNLLDGQDQLIDKRYLLNKTGRAALEDIIKMAKQTPGFFGTTEPAKTYLARLESALEKTRTDVDFPTRKAAALAEVTAILTKPNIDPVRFGFINSLSTLMSAHGSKTDLEKIETDILKPLEDSILSSDQSDLATHERTIISQVRASITTINDTQNTDLFSLYAPKDILNNIDMLKAPALQVSTLTKLFALYQEADTPTDVIPVNQHAKMLSTVKGIFESRNELTRNAKTSFKTLILALNGEASLKATMGTELQTLLDDFDTLVEFSDLLATAIDKLDSILYQQGTPERAAFFTFLSSMIASPGNKGSVNLESLKANIIKPLQSRSLSSKEKSTIELLLAAIERIESAPSLWKKFDDPKDVLRDLKDEDFATQLNDIEELLLRQLDEKNIKRLTKTDAIHHILLMNLLGSMVDHRESLKTVDRRRLGNIIKKANSTTPGIADATQPLTYNSNPDDESIESETLPQLLERLNTEVPFSTRLGRTLESVARKEDGSPSQDSITLKLSDDPTRVAFFTSLKTLLQAPGSKSQEDLAALDEAVVDQLKAVDTTPTEVSILTAVDEGIDKLLESTSLWEQFGNPKEVLAALANPELDVSFAAQLDDLEQLLEYQANEDNARRLTPASASEHNNFIKIVGNLVNYRDELHRTERSRLTAIIKKANSTTPGIADATQQVLFTANPESAGNEPEAMAEMLERLTTEVPFALRKQKVLDHMKRVAGVPDKNNMSLKLSDDPKRKAFFQSLSTLLDAPGAKSDADLTALREQVFNQFKSAEKTAAEELVLEKLNDGIESLLAKTNLWEQANGDPAFIIANISAVTNLVDRIGLLQRLLLEQVDAEEHELIKSDDYQDLVNSIGQLVANRDELPNTIQLDNLIKTANSTRGLKDAQVRYIGKSLSDLLIVIEQGIPFTDRVNKMLTRVSTIIGMVSTAPERQEFFNYLRTLFDAPGTKDDSTLDSVMTQIIEKIQKTRHTPGEAEVLKLLEQRIEFLRANTDLFAKYDNNAAAVAQSINDQIYPDKRLKDIVRLIDMQIAEKDTNIFEYTNENGEKIDATETVILAIGDLVGKRYELSGNEKKVVRQTLTKCNTIPRIRDERASTIASLVQSLEEKVPFITLYSSLAPKVETIIVTTGSDEHSQYKRKRFFATLAQLFDSLVGEDLLTSTDLKKYITDVDENIIKPLAATPLEQNEQDALTKVEEMGKELLSRSNTFISRLRLAQLSSEKLYNYAEALSDIFYKKATGVTFSDNDYGQFTDECEYIVRNRELLLTTEKKFVEGLLRNAQISADFAAHKDRLVALWEEIKTMHEFKSRIEYAVKEVDKLMKSSDATSVKNPYQVDEQNYFFQRFMKKVGNIQNTGKTVLDAPGMKTEEQFITLESQVLMALGSNDLLDDETREKVDALLVTLRASKEKLLEDQKTFQYHFDLATEQEANSAIYITALKDIIYNQRQGKIAFDFGDDEEMLEAVENITAERDALDEKDIELLKTTINYMLYSTVYEDGTLRTRLLTANEDLNTTIPLATRINNYIEEIEDDETKLIFLDSNDPVRVKFFIKLSRLREAPELQEATSLETVRTLMSDIQTQIIDVLMPTASNNEKQVLKTLSRFIDSITSETKTAMYQLGVASRSLEDLFAYAQEVNRIMIGKDIVIKFEDGAEEQAAAAINHIADYRAQLTGEQLEKVQNNLRRVLGLPSVAPNSFKSAKAIKLLKELQEELATVHDFGNRIEDINDELFKHILKKPKRRVAISDDEWEDELEKRLSSIRFGRLIRQVSLILDAPGTKTQIDFDNLDSLLSTINSLPLPDDHAATIDGMIATFNQEKKDEIFEAQKQFTYHLDQADEHRDNLSVYTSSMRKIIENKRLGTVAFTPSDYQTFIDRLTVLTDERDAMAPEDLSTLQKTINYAYYSSGFSSNPAHKQALLSMYQLAKSEVSFKDRVLQYVTQLTGQDENGSPLQDARGSQLQPILELNADNPRRIRFFSKMEKLSKVQGVKELDDLKRLQEKVLVVLQEAPTSPEESEKVEALNGFVETSLARASTYLYNESILLTRMQEKRGSTDQSEYIKVVLDGVNDLVSKRNAGLVVFNKSDYPKVISFTKSLVNDRDLYSPEQVGEVQALVRLIQNGAGFSSFDRDIAQKDGSKVKLFDDLYNKAGSPLTFEERVDKYQQRIGEISNAPTDDPGKHQFAVMVSTIFEAPGERTEDTLNDLESRILTPILHGAFTDEQRDLISSTVSLLSTEKSRLNSFDYRFEQALTSQTSASLHSALRNILDSYDPNATDPTAMTIDDAQFTRLTDTLRKEVALRTPTTTPTVIGLLEMLKTKQPAAAAAA